MSPLARVFKHTSVLDVEVTLRCHGSSVRLSPKAMALLPIKISITIADIYRLFEERFDRQLNRMKGPFD